MVVGINSVDGSTVEEDGDQNSGKILITLLKFICIIIERKFMLSMKIQRLIDP